MHRRRAFSGVVCGVVCAVAAVALGACATPGYDPGRIQSELVQAGTTPDQARCITRGLTDTFAVSQLGSHSEPSALTTPSDPKNEFDKTRDILAKCEVKLPLIPQP